MTTLYLGLFNSAVRVLQNPRSVTLTHIYQYNVFIPIPIRYPSQLQDLNPRFILSGICSIRPGTPAPPFGE